MGYKNLQKASGVSPGRVPELGLPQKMVFSNIKDPVLEIKKDETRFAAC